MRQRLLPLAPFVLASAVALSGTVDAQQSSILHEFLPPDAQEDLSYTTTIEGGLPSAVQTPSGIATAPDPRRPPDAQKLYGGSTLDDSPESTYEPDRDTRRPHVENYEDPFTPSTAPFKRLRAFDAVLDDYTLAVRDKTLQTVPIGGTLGAGDEPFYGDISVGLIPEQPVRIPSVGPGARLLRLSANPDARLEVVHDGADNWFVRGHARKEVRLVVQLGIPRATFGSEFADVSWSKLDRYVAMQPAAHRVAFAQVATAVGISRDMRPREALEKMVEYFRAFEPSDDPPRGRDDIYLDLALEKKGVCRHRAFAFLVTALNIGLPTRMIVNEAHAWVEVFDDTLWHRIDLGGAALNMETQDEDQRPAHQPPPDPYAWPENQDSGQDMADRARNSAGGQSAAPQTSPTASTTSPNATTPDPQATTPPTSLDTQPADPDAPSAEISVTTVAPDVRRGMPIHLRGEVKSGGSACPHVRVDVLLRGAAAPEGVVVGSLSTDERGAYDGPVVVPRELTLGEYELVLRTPGGARCGPGEIH